MVVFTSLVIVLIGSLDDSMVGVELSVVSVILVGPFSHSRGGESNFPYILLNEIQTMFSQLAKQSVRF